MTIDTSREAVERLARDHMTVGDCHKTYVMGHPHHWKTAQVLAALLAERDEYRDQIAELLPAANREAVEQRARAEAAEAREQALLTSYDEERKALVENASLRERLKAAEELLQFIAEVAPVADKTCDDPGITFVEACRREMKERRNAG